MNCHGGGIRGRITKRQEKGRKNGKNFFFDFERGRMGGADITFNLANEAIEGQLPPSNLRMI